MLPCQRRKGLGAVSRCIIVCRDDVHAEEVLSRNPKALDGKYECSVKLPSEWSVAPTPWVDIHRLLGSAGIVTPDATGDSVQFERIQGDVIAGSSAKSQSSTSGAKFEPAQPTEQAPSSSSTSAALDRPRTYAQVKGVSPLPLPQIRPIRKAKGKGK